MDDNQLIEALRREFRKEIPKKFWFPENIKLDKDEKIFENDDNSTSGDNRFKVLLSMINDLTFKLVNAKVDLWLRNHSSEGKE